MSQVTASIGRTRYKTILNSENHELVGDEPAPYGTDLGPNPYDFLLMGLGSCVAMTLRMYADRKKWDLQSVEVRLDQSRVYEKDCENCESNEGFVHKIKKSIKLTGNLDKDQRARLMEIAEKCPVNKTLTNEIRMETRGVIQI